MLISSLPKATGQKHYGSADYWNDQWKLRPADKVSDHVTQAMIALAQMQDGARKCIVEIGCGLNPVIEVLRAVVAPSAQYVAYDISEVAQAENAARFPWGNWYTGDIAQNDDVEHARFWQNGAADFVLSSHLIEHLEDPYQLIEEQLRICKPGGVIAIAAPLHMHHREHRQVFAIGDIVGMLKDYGNPVICYVDARETEIVAGLIKHGT